MEAGVNTRIAGWWLVAGWLAGYVIVYWLGKDVLVLYSVFNCVLEIFSAF